ncbi:DUF4139 domain-containing protein [Ketobacter alkanivorans]|uniref:DUF4139 domain-containing protein n=1 Tax=Ketobacter alkanivorans TaxID=1917421 RepID=A0A2K9LGP5_9GAMM|nr:DUF4139 domain-containing protein [Ketobacter alkanivorans]AUM11413.1 hypothetical protein Kalk_02785 [Ketobacter alkanivorans]
MKQNRNTPKSALSIAISISLAVGLFSVGIRTAVSAPSLTIYNGNFAVVRDTIKLNLSKGDNDVKYQDITKQLEPDSVVFRPTDTKWPLSILEQNYLSLPVNEALLLNYFEGQTIDFEVIRNKQTSNLPGKIIRSGLSGGSPIIEMEGKTRFGLPGRPLFPALKDDTLLKPTLAWQLKSGKSGEVNAELAYLTGGLNWKADYNLIAKENTDKVNVNGWVTFENQSGKSFNAAKIKLMAGDINKLSPPSVNLYKARAMAMEMAMDAPSVTQKDFDEYHLYAIGRPIDLADGESKQVAFVDASGVISNTRFIYDGAQIDQRYQPGMERIRSDPNYGTQSNNKVWIYREFNNSKKNGLGIPLPKGRVRFYQADNDGQLEFLGENNIDHTATEAKVSLYTGNAFDVVGSRKRLDFQMNDRQNSAQESFAITLKNSKKVPVTVSIVEHLYRWTTWSIQTHSSPFDKTDAQTIEFEVELKPDQEKTTTYTVHYQW